MRIGQVAHVNIVADPRSVRSWIIGAKDLEVVDMALQRHHGSRNEMRFRVAEFAYVSFGIRTAGIEITKYSQAKAIGSRVIRQNPLDRQLRSAIGIQWSGICALDNRHGV